MSLRTAVPLVVIPFIALVAIVVEVVGAQAAADAQASSSVLSLNGPWRLATDPNNVGREEKWFAHVPSAAAVTKTPGVLQDTFPGYHGLVWYYREFIAPTNPDPNGRYLLRFWSADYKADVWLNGVSVGSHEGADGVFAIDATSAIKPGRENLVAVRLLNPKDEPIDGIRLTETPHRNKTQEFTFGSDYNHGGLEDSVNLLVVPVARIDDLFVRADARSGVLRIQTKLRNASAESLQGHLEWTVSPAASGKILAVATHNRKLTAGDTLVETEVKIENPRLWELNDPYLYRVTARLRLDRNGMINEQSTRCGFRDFRIDNGFFHLNGKRLFLKCTHTGNDSMIGIHVCYDHDFFRRDLLNQKAMGFNAVRFIAGCGTPWQLDLCNEIGMMVYEEPYSSWLLADSPKMKERFDRSTTEMILRDRNHPSVAIWGLLNETEDGPVFRHAVETLPLVRGLDDSRMVLLSSGRFDRQLGIGSVSNPGSNVWEFQLGEEHQGGGASPGKIIAPTCEGLGDFHSYPQVPHSAEAYRFLRTIGKGGKPVFVSEYGIASSVNLVRIVRNFQQRGAGDVNAGAFLSKDAQSIHGRLGEMESVGHLRPAGGLLRTMCRGPCRSTIPWHQRASIEPRSERIQPDRGDRPRLQRRRVDARIPRAEARHGRCDLRRLFAAAMVYVRRTGPFLPRRRGQTASGARQRGHFGPRRVSRASRSIRAE